MSRTSISSTSRDCTLRTARGSLLGIEVSDARTNQPVYRRYARIRYALPPTGNRRWRRPKMLPADWIFSDGNNNARDYRNFGAACPQQVPDEGTIGTADMQHEMDEDCLFLNIWVPIGGEGPVEGWPVQFVFREATPLERRDDTVLTGCNSGGRFAVRTWHADIRI